MTWTTEMGKNATKLIAPITIENHISWLGKWKSLLFKNKRKEEEEEKEWEGCEVK